MADTEWVTVPRELTKEQLEAFDDAGSRGYTRTWTITADAAWKAFLSAAPPPPPTSDSEAVRLLREAVGKVYRDWLAANDSRATAPERPVVLPELSFDDAMHFGATSTKRLNELRIEAVLADREGR